MKKFEKIACKNCGSQEFITALNAYDVYEVIDKQLVKTKTEFTDDDFELFCRDCSEKLDIFSLEIEG